MSYDFFAYLSIKALHEYSFKKILNLNVFLCKGVSLYRETFTVPYFIKHVFKKYIENILFKLIVETIKFSLFNETTVSTSTIANSITRENEFIFNVLI